MKKPDAGKVINAVFTVISYAIRIALAVVILWWCFGKIEFWENFQVFRQWNEQYGFEGNGTYENPYLINTADDLIKFSDAVNNGNPFLDQYFLQTCDIDLTSCENFTPVGTLDSGCMFRGVYDGGGHRLYNLKISGYGMENSFVGLFGRLGGVVMNLGIESGRISGDYVGSFASTDGSNDAMIINCYNRANLYGMIRCGGIADNFSSGRILGCANYGHLSGNVTAQIVSYNCGLISGCCNLQSSRDYMYPVNTFRGDIYDCYVGTDDLTLLNSTIDKYRSFIIFTDNEDYEVIPWS